VFFWPVSDRGITGTFILSLPPNTVGFLLPSFLNFISWCHGFSEGHRQGPFSLHECLAAVLLPGGRDARARAAAVVGLLPARDRHERTHLNAAEAASDQGRPAKNMGPVPNYTLGPQSNKANFEYLYIMLEHIFKIKSDVLIPFFF